MGSLVCLSRIQTTMRKGREFGWYNSSCHERKLKQFTNTAYLICMVICVPKNNQYRGGLTRSREPQFCTGKMF